MEVIREEMIEWWGERADSTLRRGLLYEDIKLSTEVAEDGSLKPQKWFIRNKQVCKNFYLRARRAQKETVRRLLSQICNDNRTLEQQLITTRKRKEKAVSAMILRVGSKLLPKVLEKNCQRRIVLSSLKIISLLCMRNTLGTTALLLTFSESLLRTLILLTHLMLKATD